MAYDNTARSAAARATRSRVLAAAQSTFVEHGYGRTTIKQVATSANVSPETIYKSFGGKAGLLKSAYDVALAGDDDEVPLAERPEVIEVRRASDPDSAVAAYCTLAQLISSRVDPLLRMALGARDTDAALSEFTRTIDDERWKGSAFFVRHLHDAGWLRTDLTPDRATDILFALNSNGPRWALQDRGWTPGEISEWLAHTLSAALLR